MRRWLSLSAAAVVVGGVAFWATLVTDPPKTEAEAIPKFDIGEMLKSARQDASVQDPSVIGCTYVLTDGLRCR